MKQLTILLSFLLTSNLLWGQNFTLSPAAPKAGDLVRAEFDLSKSKLRNSAEIELFVLEYANGKANVIEAATMRSGDKFVGIFTLGATATGAVAGLRTGDDLWENNAGEGFFIPVHNAAGKATPEGMVASASLYRDFGGLMSLNRTPSIALGLLNQAFAAQPDLKRKHFLPYCNYLMAAKKNNDEARQESLQLIASIENDASATEDELLSALRFFERNTEMDRAKALKDKIKASFPKGTLVKQEKRRLIQSEADLAKAESMLAEYVSQFPPQNDEEKQALNTLRANLANKMMDAGNRDRFRSLAAQLPDADRAKNYNSLAWELAEKGQDLEEARTLAATATNWARQEMKMPKEPKPQYSTVKEWEEQRRQNFAAYADTYAFVLSKSGDNIGAANLQAEVVDLTKGKEAEMNERYVGYLEASNAPELRNRLENFIISGHATAKMKDLFRKIYAAEDKTESGAAAYLAKLEIAAKASKQRELQEKMLNEPSPTFSLVNLEGKTVSLESLRGKVVVVDFWATWCGPCKASFPGMQMAVNRYKDDPNVAFLFVDSWERAADKNKNAADFIASKGYTFNVLMDNDDKVISSYGVSGIPTKYVIDRNGKIRFKAIGFDGSDEGLADELGLMIEVARSQP